MPCVTGPVSRRALAACSKDGADPYVSLLLLPDKKGASKRKTATKKRDLNPEFNERWAGRGGSLGKVGAAVARAGEQVDW